MMRWCECALTSLYNKRAFHTHYRVMWSEMNNRIVCRQHTVNEGFWRRRDEGRKKRFEAEHNGWAIRDSFHIWFNQFNTLNMSPAFFLFIRYVAWPNPYVDKSSGWNWLCVYFDVDRFDILGPRSESFIMLAIGNHNRKPNLTRRVSNFGFTQ